MQRFKSGFNAPPLSGKVLLNLEAPDEEGGCPTPERALKSLILDSIRADDVVSPTAGPFTLHGVSGMAGTGKTTALMAMAHDAEIREQFTDGVLYMKIGRDATEEDVLRELGTIMLYTGAHDDAVDVGNAQNLADGMSNATLWFCGRRILFLIDDIWPLKDRPEGYLPDLERLLIGSPESRICISTPSVGIAVKMGSFVDFRPREPRGPDAVSIFMSHAAPEISLGEDLPPAAESILDLCGGLPIALAVTGEAVSFRKAAGLGFEYACSMYSAELSAQLNPGASMLDKAIDLSLDSIVIEPDEQGNMPPYSIHQMYASLSILKAQQVAPIQVLARMWKISNMFAETICLLFTSMSLAKMSAQKFENGDEECGFYVHDLQLKYCRQLAQKNGEEKEWHRRLLEGHMPRSVSPDGESDDTDADVLGLNMLKYTPRSWWQKGLLNRRYIHKNLTSHLRQAGLNLELGAVVTDVRWMSVHACTGGILGLRTDLEILEDVLSRKAQGSVQRSFRSIRKLVEASSSNIRGGVRVLSFILLSRLLEISTTDEFLAEFLRRVNTTTPRPFLAPSLSLFRPPGDALKAEIDIRKPRNYGDDAFCRSVGFSSSEEYIVASANKELIVLNPKNQEIEQTLKGHFQDVSIVIFNSDASVVVSGGYDFHVMVWHWKTEQTPFWTLRGHRKKITGLSFSGDESTLISTSLDGVVKVWDMNTGRLDRQFIKEPPVCCVAACPTNNNMAIGTIDGKIRVYNYESGDLVFETTSSDLKSVDAVAFSADGKCLGTGSSAGNVVTWNTTNWTAKDSAEAMGSVTHLSFSASGTQLLIGTDLGRVQVWDLDSGEYSVEVRESAPILSCAFRKNSDEIIVGLDQGLAHVWSCSSLKESPFIPGRGYVTKCTLSEDGTRVASLSADNSLCLWDAQTGRELKSYAAPGNYTSISLSPDGKTIVGTSQDGPIQAWNSEVSSDKKYDLAAGACSDRGASFSGDGHKLLTFDCAGATAGTIQIWDVNTRTMTGNIFEGVPQDLYLAGFSADARYVITLHRRRRFTIWDVGTEQNVFDSSKTTPQTLSNKEAMKVIPITGRLASELWLQKLQPDSRFSGNLSVDNILMCLPYDGLFRDLVFSSNVVMTTVQGYLTIFRLDFGNGSQGRASSSDIPMSSITS